MNEKLNKKSTECKSCKKEVPNPAKACPHCGNKDPASYGKIVIYLFIAVAIIGLISDVFLGDPNPVPYKSKLLDDIEYGIIQDDEKRDIKRSFVVRLEKKVSRNILKEIALTIKGGTGDKSYEKVFIGYVLPGKEDDGYWATTNFTPNLEVKIIGLSIEDGNALKN